MAHPEAAQDFIHTITRLSRDATRGPKGDPVLNLGNQVTFKGRAEFKGVRERGADGWRTVMRTILITDVWLEPDDHIWLPAFGARPADDVADIEAARTPTLARHAADENGLNDLFEYEL